MFALINGFVFELPSTENDMGFGGYNQLECPLGAVIGTSTLTSYLAILYLVSSQKNRILKPAYDADIRIRVNQLLD